MAASGVLYLATIATLCVSFWNIKSAYAADSHYPASTDHITPTSGTWQLHADRSDTPPHRDGYVQQSLSQHDKTITSTNDKTITSTNDVSISPPGAHHVRVSSQESSDSRSSVLGAEMDEVSTTSQPLLLFSITDIINTDIINNSNTGIVSNITNSSVFMPHYYSTEFATVATSLSAIIFTLGLLGNLLVVVVIVRIHSMQTTTNCYLLSLALSDSMVLISATLPAIPGKHLHT